MTGARTARAPRAGGAAPRPSMTARESRTLRLAHRGDHRRVPENTLAAFRAALAAPACDGLEFDVRLSRDGVPVVLHDETLARAQGRPERAADLVAVELRALGVPSLAEVLASVPRGAFLDVELKVDGGRAVVDVLRAGRGERLDRTVVSSFVVAALEGVRRREPAWPTWLNAEDLGADTVSLARRLGCVGISAERRGIDRAGMDRAAAAGLAVAAWTVTRLATYRRLAALGVAAVCVEGPALDG